MYTCSSRRHYTTSALTIRKTIPVSYKSTPISSILRLHLLKSATPSRSPHSAGYPRLPHSRFPLKRVPSIFFVAPPVPASSSSPPSLTDVGPSSLSCSSLASLSSQSPAPNEHFIIGLCRDDADHFGLTNDDFDGELDAIPADPTTKDLEAPPVVNAQNKRARGEYVSPYSVNVVSVAKFGCRIRFHASVSRVTLNSLQLGRQSISVSSLQTGRRVTPVHSLQVHFTTQLF